LYEAAVLGLAAFKKHDIELHPKGLTHVHAVAVQKVHKWLEQGVKSPKEAALKDRLRALP